MKNEADDKMEQRLNRTSIVDMNKQNGRRRTQMLDALQSEEYDIEETARAYGIETLPSDQLTESVDNYKLKSMYQPSKDHRKADRAKRFKKTQPVEREPSS